MISPPSSSLPSTHRALVLKSLTSLPTLQTLPIPTLTAGSALVRILTTGVVSYTSQIYTSHPSRQHPLPLPLITGSSAIGRIASLCPSAISLKPGNFVFISTYLTAPDAPDVHAIQGIHEGFTPDEKALMGEWKDGSFAEYMRVPIQNCVVLDEERLLGKEEGGGLGLRVEDLMYIAPTVIPYSGLREMGVKAGETVIIAPATGEIGAAAVIVALAIGASVIALGRNGEKLKRLEELSSRVKTVRITGDIYVDMTTIQSSTRAKIDAYLDLSPPEAESSTHIKSCLLALKSGGTVCLMGGIASDIQLPYGLVMWKNLVIKGRCMYSPETVRELVKMVESGVLVLGPKGGIELLGPYELDEWEEAWRVASEKAGLRKICIMDPV